MGEGEGDGEGEVEWLDLIFLKKRPEFNCDKEETDGNS